MCNMKLTWKSHEISSCDFDFYKSQRWQQTINVLANLIEIKENNCWRSINVRQLFSAKVVVDSLNSSIYAWASFYFCIINLVLKRPEAIISKENGIFVMVSSRIRTCTKNRLLCAEYMWIVCVCVWLAATARLILIQQLKRKRERTNNRTKMVVVFVQCSSPSFSPSLLRREGVIKSKWKQWMYSRWRNWRLI